LVVKSSVTHVAFLRAINVRGHKIVRMTDLTRAFVEAGCTGVRTIIQSGNVLFEPPSAKAAALDTLRDKLRDILGQDPGVFFRTLQRLDEIVHAPPPPGFMARTGVKRYVAFLSKSPRSKPSFPLRSLKERLEAVAMQDREVFIVSRRKPNGFYGLPNNFIEQELGVSATTRNWSTLVKIVGMVRTEQDA
jgi:uncharacterized protein (DUF1697 family)